MLTKSMETQSQHQKIHATLPFLVETAKTRTKALSNTKMKLKLNVVDKQTYLGLDLEPTSSGRCAYARYILNKNPLSFIDNKKVVRKYGYKYYWNKEQTFWCPCKTCATLWLRNLGIWTPII